MQYKIDIRLYSQKNKLDYIFLLYYWCHWNR